MKQAGKFYKKEDVYGQDYIVICIECESESYFWGTVIKCDPRHECQAARFSADDFEECKNPYLEPSKLWQEMTEEDATEIASAVIGFDKIKTIKTKSQRLSLWEFSIIEGAYIAVMSSPYDPFFVRIEGSVCMKIEGKEIINNISSEKGIQKAKELGYYFLD